MALVSSYGAYLSWSRNSSTSPEYSTQFLVLGVEVLQFAPCQPLNQFTGVVVTCNPEVGIARFRRDVAPPVGRLPFGNRYLEPALLPRCLADRLVGCWNRGH